MDEGDFSKSEFRISYDIVSVKTSFVTDIKLRRCCSLETMTAHNQQLESNPFETKHG